MIGRFVVSQHEVLSYEKVWDGSRALFHSEQGVIRPRGLSYDSIVVENSRFNSSFTDPKGSGAGGVPGGRPEPAEVDSRGQAVSPGGVSGDDGGMKTLEFRSFFVEEEARVAIFSTYEFEPVHFEKFLLWTKALGSARRIIVMVDAGRFQRLLAECKTAARSLNQHYLVVPVRKPGGVFHPKLALLLGENYAEVICGSNNLTQPGSTHNLELLNRVPVRVEGASEIAHLQLVREAIQFFKDCTAYGETRASVIASKWLGELENEFPWLSRIHQHGRNEGPALVHTMHGGLWNWLKAKVDEERPQKIQIISPFYDSDLGLLSRVRKRWPDCPVEITAQQNTSNLPVNLLVGFGKALRLFDLPNEDSRRLHAKLLVVNLNGKCLCLAGSANLPRPHLTAVMWRPAWPGWLAGTW